jgi:ribose 5-phosphate isomerase RpiB
MNCKEGHGDTPLRFQLHPVRQAASKCRNGASPADSVARMQACPIHDSFSARQEGEDDDMNVICMGGQVAGNARVKELPRTSLQARLGGAGRHRRRLAKVAILKGMEAAS